MGTKPELQQIYQNLSLGKLSQEDAFERIKAIKLREPGKRSSVLLATPVWEGGGAEVRLGRGSNEYTQQHVILCELPQVKVGELESLVGQSQCVALQAREGKNIAQRYSKYAVTSLERIRAIFQGKPPGKVLVQIVVANNREQAVLAGLSGLLQTAALENPQVIGQLILVPAQTTAEQLAGQLREENSRGRDTVVKYEQGERQVLGWQEIEADAEKPAIAFQEEGVYLITGGLGGLGVLFAKEILERTRTAKVVLTGRSALSAGKRAQLDELPGASGRVSYRQVDVGNRDQVQQLMAAIREEYGHLNGILHSAGMIADNFIWKKASAQMREVLAPKVTGTYNLDEASQDIGLDFLVLFSSLAGALGNVGQADYAAANGFMDQFAAYRNGQVAAKRRQGRTRSINWGLWQSGGMGLDAASREQLRQSTGTQPLEAAVGIEAFYRSLALPYDRMLVVAGDRAQLRRALLAGRRPVVPDPSPRRSAGVRSLARQTGGPGTDVESLVEKTQEYLRKELADVLKLPPHKIDLNAGLEKYGIDSILAIKLTNLLQATFGSLSKTLFFEYQSIGELSRYFVESHGERLASLLGSRDRRQAKGEQEASAMRAETLGRVSGKAMPSRRFLGRPSAVPGATTEAEPIAMIGLSGRYPESVNLEAYWHNLRAGKDCIVEVPRARWDWRKYFSEDRTKNGCHYSKWGGFIVGVDEFDPLFFNISPREAERIDPQERLFLEHAWMAVEDAGYTRASLQVPDKQDLAGQVGVYAGVMYNEYQLFGVEASVQGKRRGFAGSSASIANRVSYALNLHGPSMTLDTMCSSSLTAIHIACQDLKLGRTSLAIAGGVNVSIHPNKYLMLSDGQFISSDGHCQSFGEGGDGYIPGEGVGVVVLKRLSEAERDGDHIYGIIRGSALTHGGKTNGYTVPNPQAQTGAIGRALAEAGIEAQQISYIEAHGTGTKLGDPIEIAALSKAFQRSTKNTGFCWIGSAKSNVGHCESAAGMAGLTKVLLQMQHGELVPSLHAERLNPHIEFAQSPFVVNRELRAWERPVIEGRKRPRIAGISSFGAGGSNAHMIVEEYWPGGEAGREASLVPRNTKTILPLSARTGEQLRQKGRELLDFVRPRLSTIDLVAMAYTLQAGREAMDERLGLVVSSVEQLAQKLEAYVAGEQGIEDVYEGQVKRNQEALSLFSTDVDLQQTVDKWMANKKLSKLAELWVKGLELDWSKLYGEVKPRRISLPTYPFAKERYWIDTAVGGAVSANGASAAVLHPLLHRNTSDMSEQRYSSTFRGEEFFLTDHRVRANGHGSYQVLPGVAYLEMARAAIEQAWPSPWQGGILELHNTVWARPMIVSEKKQVSIALCANDNDNGQLDYEIYSQQGEQEIVHCQGQAVWSGKPAPVRLDLQQLQGQMGGGKLEAEGVYSALARMGLVYGPGFQAIRVLHQGSNQVLAQLRLPAPVEDTAQDYVLHPSLMDGALQACVAMMDGWPEGSTEPRLPFALQWLRIVSGSTREMMAWVRYAPGSQAWDAMVKLDIDLCDEHGNACAQMRGVSWTQASLEIAEAFIPVRLSEEAASPTAPAALTNITLAPPVRKEIAFSAHQQATPTPVARKKPTGISLAAPGTVVPAAAVSSENTLGQSSAGRASITLSSARLGWTMQASEAPAVSSVRLFDCGNGIFSIQVGASGSNNRLSPELLTQLRQALERVQQEAQVKVLTIGGAERSFLCGSREDSNEAVAQGFYRALLSFPYPVIGVLQGDASGAGFLAAALCDFMVCNEDATYGYTDPQTHFYPTTAEAILFSERFDTVQAEDFLYGSTASTGKQLRTKGWTCPIVAGVQVEAYAQELASTLATNSQHALRLLKQHLTRPLAGLVQALTQVDAAPAATENPSHKVEKTIASPAKHLHLDTPLRNVLVVRFGVANNNVGVKELVADLGSLFAWIHELDDYKAIVLVSEYPDFVPGTKLAIAEQVVLDFKRLVVESPIPVVAALEGNAKGDAWLIGQFCDACVYSQTGRYSAAAIGQSPATVQAAAAIFTHRLGNYAGKEILLSGGDYSGVDLQQRVGALIVAEQDRVLPTALTVAESWARLPRATLASWKKQTAATLQRKILSLPAAAESEQKDEAPEGLAAAPSPIALHSKVVTATAYPEGIVVVKMQDRQAKNMFSDAFIEGVTEVFAHVERTPAYKVVILTGYDSYFASGGTKESLLAIQEGQAKFTDIKIFQVALDCKLPVIAAIQGHGIGAGWSLGMFADFVLLSEESWYVSPYMRYGFTPGAGATYIFADKIGHDLARESLLTAQDYSGRELKARGLRLPVLPRAKVLPAAMTLARQIAQGSRRRLLGFKQQLTWYLHQPLEQTYRLELAMHEKTFVGQSGTRERIQNNFYQEIEASPVSAQPAPVEPENPSLDRDVLPAVTASLKTLLANELQMRESDIDEHGQFVDLGLDSITGVTWVRKINEKYRTSIEAIKVYSYPTLTQLSRYVKEEAEKHGTLSIPAAPPAGDMPVASGKSASAQNRTATRLAVEKLTSRRRRTASRSPSAVAVASSPGPIAVIGMAGQFPQARNLDEYWDNLAQGRNCISLVPPGRWDVNAYYQPGGAVPGKTNSQWVGALEEYDRFDALFFNISPTEAESMDPQQRLFLQACWHVIENAGYDARALSGSRCGVFVGCASGDYHQLSRQHQLTAQGFTGGAMSILAARICYFLNLKGPCLSIDTACSSSLVAIADACDSLISGGSDVALAAGVFVMTGPDMHIKTSQAGMLSPQGKCFTFDQRADGIVIGEAVGVVMLKRLADAERDGDNICGLIQGWGVNQDGRTNGITAPNQESQTLLEQEVYDKYQIDPGNIQLVEAHGTGTKLGDPIEVEGLKRAFRKYTRNKEFCALGSVKSNIGHCLTAAGITGFIKLLLALKHKQLPPAANFERLNEHIDLKDTPFYVNRQLQEWPLNHAARRHAAISSFGFSGTNAHIVIGEYLPPLQVKPAVTVVTQEGKIIIPLSARKPEQLKQKARDLLGWIGREAPSVDLVEVAYSLQVGRAAMEQRIGLLVSSFAQLAEKLEAYVEGRTGIEDLYQAEVKRNQESTSILSLDDETRESIVDRWIAGRKLSRLLELWVNGLPLDWNRLYGEAKPRRVNLPTYPFAKERYWIEAVENKPSPAGSSALPSVLHPLLHRNTSDLSEQRYSTTFTGQEFFLADHWVKGDGGKAERVLPGVACLEMTRLAIEHASIVRPESAILELRNTVWPQPIVVDGSKEVSIALAADDQGQIEYEIYSKQGEQESVHCHGRAVWSREPVPAPLDLQPLKYQMAQGKLERLRLPAEQGDDAYLLHPTLMDGVLQAATRLLDDATPRLPHALELLRIIAPCRGEITAWVRYSPARSIAPHSQQFDIDLVDPEGRACVQIRGLQFAPAHVSESALSANRKSGAGQPREEGKGGLHSLIPVWSSLRVEASQGEMLPESTRILLLGGHQAQLDWVRKSYPNSRLLQLDSRSSAPLIQQTLVECSFDQLLWVAPDAMDDDGDGEGDESLIDEQNQGVLAVFRMVKGLLDAGYAGKPLRWTFVTRSTQPVTQDDLLHPAHASIIGLVGALAGEYPQWDLTLLDADSMASVTAQQCLSLPWGKRGNLLARRRGQWFQRLLAPAASLVQSSPVYRQNGVYVVIGGAGGLGQVWSRFMLDNYQATLIWIGRRAYDTTIEEKINASTRRGHAPLYISADATDLNALQRAFATIRATYPVIHGVVHSAIVLHDQSLARMDESDFRAALSAKVDTSVNVDKVFGGQELDFMIFFSSVISFLKAPGQSNYAAGCTFKDSFAHKLQQERPYPVKIVNWGYWGSVGVVSDQSHREIIEQMGIGSIEPEEGMASLQAFMRCETRQMVLIKMLDGEALARLMPLAITGSMTGGGGDARLSLPEPGLLAPTETFARLRDEPVKHEFEKWCTQLLFHQVQLMLNETTRQTAIAFSDVAERCGVSVKYLPWWNESLHVLCQNNYLALQGGTISVPNPSAANVIHDTWQSKKERFCRHPDFRALAVLVSDCMEALPDILRGRILATDVLFPNSSVQRVEGVYSGSALSETFHGIVADAVVAHLQQRLLSDFPSPLRILEIGAGTGATSAVVFARLRPFQQSIEVYCYTDLSRAFFLHAEQNYIPQNPYVQCRRLDIEQPVEDQGFELGGYDLVIAANVLHATTNIRRSLQNAKALLRPGGSLILNEISGKSLPAHLTFGLLDGWWRFEDADLRMPSCPGLCASQWQEVLGEEGFRSIQFPAKDGHDLGYQIIVAQSDGILPQTKKVAGIAPANGIPSAPGKVKRHSQRTAPPSASPASLEEHVRAAILACLSSVLRISAAVIDVDAAFSDYGIDSILGVKFIEETNQHLSIKLNTAIIFEYPSLARLSKYVLETCRDQIQTRLQQQIPSDLAPLKPPAAPREATVLSLRRTARRLRPTAAARLPEIAVIGMSGMFPAAKNVAELWRNLVQGVDAIEELPASYLDQKGFFSEKKQPGKTRCKWGGIVRDRDCFDPLFFNLSPQEAESMNPHQRLVLQEGWRAIEDAGYNPKGLRGSPTGIFIGAEPTGYLGETFTGYSDALIASRLSYVLNLTGPAFVVNTGCSSSGVAIHLACESLRHRETDLALAGGVNACMEQRVQISLDEIGMLSSSGRCRAFDSAADGTIVSEAVAIVVLKRLEDAVRDGDLIYGVISGSGINQDGASNGITAPNGAAQEQLIATVYQKFGIDPEQIGYVEAHGTGTILGDPVEANALVRAFRKFTTKTGYCALGSAKSHIGHTAAAAGVTGLIKILLLMQHNRVPALLHFRTLNPLVELDGSPFYIATRECEWNSQPESPRMAALNSFGHSGTNAHLVVREYVGPATDIGQTNVPVIVPLSAGTKDQLRQKAVDLLDVIRGAETVNLARLAYTLQISREAMEQRVAFLVSSVEELAKKLQSYLLGEQAILAGDTRMATHLESWVHGAELNWDQFYGAIKPRRMRLPGYPFAKEHYWAGQIALAKPAANPGALDQGMALIEDIIDKIDQGLVNEFEGARMLKGLAVMS